MMMMMQGSTPQLKFVYVARETFSADGLASRSKSPSDVGIRSERAVVPRTTLMSETQMPQSSHTLMTLARPVRSSVSSSLI
jgi:hypothetical protein